MKKTIVKTDNYLLIVDDSVINLDDWVYTDTEVLFQYGIEHKRNPSTKKVIAHLPFGMYSTLEGVPLLPPLEVDDDVQNLAKDYLFNDYQNHFNVKTNDEQFGVLKGYINGYNKAREKYSLSNIIDLYIKETHCGMDMWSKEENETMTTIGNIIESLSQPKMPTQFLFEMEMCPTNHASGLKLTGHQLMDKAILQNYKIKTTTNSQGQEVACGKYVYAS